MTISETLFEELCTGRGISFQPIPTTRGRRSADYYVWLNQTETVVEVKQIDPSDYERRLLATAEDDDAPAIASNVHIRIRNKFDKAKKQLKNLSEGRLPSLFILYDNTRGLSGLDNEDFLNAMHGDEVVEITTARTSGRVVKTSHTFGMRGRKVGKSHNRSVSAVCRLVVGSAGKPLLLVFHNEFATNQLPIELTRLIAHRQFIRPTSPTNEYRFWTEIS
jgi:hypothetical protein